MPYDLKPTVLARKSSASATFSVDDFLDVKPGTDWPVTSSSRWHRFAPSQKSFSSAVTDRPR